MLQDCKKVKMEAVKQKEIKLRIKNVINAHPKMKMVLEVGLGTRLSFDTRKAFGERIIYQLSFNNIDDIVFKGVDNNTLNFQAINKPVMGFEENRGYGQGRYMGD